MHWQIAILWRPSLLIPAAWLLLGSVTASHACQACIPFPQKTATDYLIQADTVVFAREDPERPFSYAPVETLKGAADDGGIDLFLNSSTRRVLAADEDRVVVLVRVGDGSWRSLGIADNDYQQVVRRIIVFANELHTGKETA